MTDDEKRRRIEELKMLGASGAVMFPRRARKARDVKIAIGNQTFDVADLNFNPLDVRTVGVDLGTDDHAAYTVFRPGSNGTFDLEFKVDEEDGKRFDAWARDFNGSHPLDAPNGTYSNIPTTPLTEESIHQAYETRMRRMAEEEARVYGGSQRAGKTKRAYATMEDVWEMDRDARREARSQKILDADARRGVVRVSRSRFDGGTGENGKPVIDPPCALCGGHGVDVSGMSFTERMDFIKECGGSENMGICRGCRGHLPLRRRS